MKRPKDHPELDFSADDVCRNYHGGNEESEEANLDTQKLRDRKTLYDAIKGSGSHGCICDELEVIFGMRHQTCSARLSELKRDHWITIKVDPATGVKFRRPTRSGSMAAVLIAI
jgi:hypothetical protein